MDTEPEHGCLEALVSAYGIATDFINYAGETVPLAWENRLRVLDLLDVDISSKAAAEASLLHINSQRFASWVPKALVVEAGHPIQIPVHLDVADLSTPIRWNIETERGEHFAGEFIPSDLPETGTHTLASHCISTRTLNLPELPPGYHPLTLSSVNQQIQTTLITAPDVAYSPEWLAQNHKLAGLSVQVYTLRSEHNWGMGDFSDLQDTVIRAAGLGIHFLVLNPLHLLDADHPENCSPYSPMDRRFLNPLYIDPRKVEDFSENQELQGLMATPDIQSELEELRSKPQVDYTGVTRLKYDLFNRMFGFFKTNHLEQSTPRAADFYNYIDGKGEPGQVFANDQAVKNQFTLEHARDPPFHFYLQWLAEIQLEACQQLALRHGMAVGLIRDLAVASSSSSAEVQLNPGLFCTRASIGAPPDPLGPQGQNWGLPPMKPTVLVDSGYAHFITLLQNNMAHCGALRIDHIMALMRLWWCPGPGDSSTGAYVRYPVADLFAILRLESLRQQCVVIGEDLGVVPPEIRERMAHSGILSNALFYFEKYDGVVFKRPEHFAPRCLAMVANHDVPTLTAWWNKTDIALRQEIGLLDDEEVLAATIHGRESDLIQVLHWVNNAGLLPQEWLDFNIHRPFDEILCRAIFHTSGRMASQLVSVQIEDLCFTELPVNIPGTCAEYPNWRRKMPLSVDDLLAGIQARRMLASLTEGRRQA